jgi:hypothetical protein
MGGRKYPCKILVWKANGKRPLGRPRRSWGDNITLYLKEMALEGVDWFHLDQSRERGGGFV